VEYLGHLISKEGTSLLTAYVSNIVEWLLLSTGKDLSSILGFAGYYREFLPWFAEITANLNEVKNKHMLTWSTEMVINFNTLKRMFLAAPCRAREGVQSSSNSNHRHPNLFCGKQAPQVVISTTSNSNQPKKA